jgi:hypothetical protein
VVNQGKTLSYETARVRFKAKVSAADQELFVALNTDASGAGGLSVHLGAETGALSVVHDGKVLAGAAFGALTPGMEYYVSLSFTEKGGLVDVTRGNYAGEPGATAVGNMTSPLPKADTGTFTALKASATGVSFDNIALSECGGVGPSYETLVLDRFNRASSQNVGGPEKPVGQTYTGDDSALQISNQALEIVDSGFLTIQPGHVANAGLRLRAAVQFGTLGWMIIRYNSADDSSGNGFDLWRQDEKSFLIEYGSGGPGQSVNAPLKTTEPYFVEFDTDGAFAVVTLHTTSYTGPIVAAVR